MRFICLALLLAATSAQSTYAQSNAKVEVVRFSWAKERIGWENDPFRGPIENFDEVRARTRNERRIEDAKRGNSAEVDRIRREAKADAANVAAQHKTTESRYVFIYKTTIKNLSTKPIKSVDWDYIFLDKSNGAELGRRQFTSEEKIAPGKAKELNVVLKSPPTYTISLTSLNTKERDNLSGQVIIVRIDYADGTSWQLPEPQ
jgi:hypothetical protein